MLASKFRFQKDIEQKQGCLEKLKMAVKMKRSHNYPALSCPQATLAPEARE
jgi:hypothetical protein